MRSAHVAVNSPSILAPPSKQQVGRTAGLARARDGHRDLLQRKCAACADDELELQRKESGSGVGEGMSAPDVVMRTLAGPGMPLDAAAAQLMGSRFGRDFSHVRVYTDAQAAQSAKSVGALAYTVGPRMVFGAGQYRPGSTGGLHLIAHELAHVVQQSRHSARPSRAPVIAPAASPDEREADAFAERATAGMPVKAPARASDADVLHRSVAVDPADPAASLLLASITRLTGKTATNSGGTLTLGAAVPGAPPSSATIANYIGRAISSSRAYTLRSGATAPSGAAVRGVNFETTATGVTITVNNSNVGAFTWTMDELVSDGFARAVAANDPSAQTLAPPSGAPAGTQPVNLDALLTTQLPITDRTRLRMAMDLIKSRVPAVAADPFLEVDVENALGQGPGVTLAEVLRGLETNTPFRIRETVSGDRVNATYFDPRKSPAPNAPQQLPRRTVSFLAGASAGGTAAAPLTQQDLPSMTPQQIQQANASCTPQMMGEIRSHVTTAGANVRAAIALLNSSQNIDALLRRHFGAAGPASRPRLAANYQVILSELDVSRHAWVCIARGSGQGCNAPNVTGTTGISYHPVQLCVETSAPFIPSARTVLHEVTHASGIGTLPAGVETYEWQPAYPGADPLHNADSYARFAGDAAALPPPVQQQIVPPPGATANPPPAATGSADAGAPKLQRSPDHESSTERMHRGIADAYRRREHLPEGGVDEFGQRVGPGEGEIVHRALFFPLVRLGQMSPWELAHAPPSAFVAPRDEAAPPAGEPTYADYARAQRMIVFAHGAFGLTFDYENDFTPKGREPSAQELQVLDRNLNQLLSTFNVRSHVSGRGGRGIPAAPGGATPSLAGRVRLVATRGDFAAKHMQMDRSLGGNRYMSIGRTQIEREVRRVWSQAGITPAAGAVLTEPERVATAWWMVSEASWNVPAFFFPGEDRIYLSPGVNLSDLEGQDVARHETVHLLGGGERTRQAFLARFGQAWLRYWRPFEEGVAEYVNISSRTPAQTPPSATGQHGINTAYGEYYESVRRLVAAVGRDVVLHTYFTGDVSEAVFGRWQQIIDTPTPTQGP
jgi:hypothetical protein